MARRIASLLASGTEIVHALGLHDRLVAISHECDYPPEVLNRPRISRPRFDPSTLGSGGIDRAVRAAMAEHGSVYQVDGGTLERLRPDLVLTQAVCEVCAVPTPGVRDELARRGVESTVLSLDAHTLEDVLGTIEQVAVAAGEPARAERAVGRLRERLAAVETAVRGVPRPRVLALEWLAPPFAPGHWVPEQIERAGAVNLAGGPGARSQQVEWRELERLDPDVLVVMPCGYDTAAAESDAAAHAERLLAVAPRAVEAGRAWVVNGSAYFNRSGPRVVRGIEIMAGLLHPDRWAAPPPEQARRWRPA